MVNPGTARYATRMSAAHRQLLSWWTDEPDDPGRLTLADPDVRALIERISPGSMAVDLGGVMSLNAHLVEAGLVLRVHQHFVSRRRLLALQGLRRALLAQDLVTPRPVCWHGKPLLRCRNRWCELETFVAHRRPPRSPEGYAWMLRATGALHAALRELELGLPRPLVATYAPPGSLRRWLPVTRRAVQADPEACEVVERLSELVRQLSRQWVPARALPRQLIHGDVSPRNICRAQDERPLFLDLGFAARRPRVHELAYALAFMLYSYEAHLAPERFAWQTIAPLIAGYEIAVSWPLTSLERAALSVYAASVPLYAAALDGFTEAPAAKLKARAPFLRLSAWLLAHPDALLGRPNAHQTSSAEDR